MFSLILDVCLISFAKCFEFTLIHLHLQTVYRLYTVSCGVLWISLRYGGKSSFELFTWSPTPLEQQATTSPVEQDKSAAPAKCYNHWRQKVRFPEETKKHRKQATAWSYPYQGTLSHSGRLAGTRTKTLANLWRRRARRRRTSARRFAWELRASGSVMGHWEQLKELLSELLYHALLKG